MAALTPAEALACLQRSLALIPAPVLSGTPARIILAVSGGPDSLALLWCAALHAKALERRCLFHVVTVDHALRAASAAEAEHVRAIATRLGLSHETRPWIGDKPGSNLQGEARRARYDLLADAARETGAVAVMTAHHQDDQIETHLLAAARKAGDRGLAGMRAARELAPGLVLLRPFLDVPGARLKAMVAEAGLAAVDDPGNRDERFDRVRLRRRLGAGEIDRAAALSRISDHAARRDGADRDLAGCLAALRAKGGLTVDPLGIVRLDAAAFSAIGDGAAIELLDRILAAVGGAPYPPSRDATNRLRRSLLGEAGEKLSRTLGGVRVERGATITFSREHGRSGPRPVMVPAGGRRVLFDGRFDVDPGVASAAGATLLLAPLGRLAFGNAYQRTLPVLFDGAGTVIAAPALVLDRFSPETSPLAIAERISWRIFADLPVAATAR